MSLIYEILFHSIQDSKVFKTLLTFHTKTPGRHEVLKDTRKI
jgi:hypothetical protein